MMFKSTKNFMMSTFAVLCCIPAFSQTTATLKAIEQGRGQKSPVYLDLTRDDIAVYENDVNATEVKSLRDASSRTFDLGGGRFVKQQTAGFFNYKDEDGNWKMLQQVPSFRYRNDTEFGIHRTDLPLYANVISGRTGVMLQKGISIAFGSNSNIRFVKSDGAIAGSVAGSFGNGYAIEGDALMLHNIFPSVDRKQSFTYYGVTTDYLVKQPMAIPGDAAYVVFEENFTLPQGVSIAYGEGELIDNKWHGELVFRKGQQTIGTYSEGVIYDSSVHPEKSGEGKTAGLYTFRKLEDNNWEILLWADAGWMRAPGRVFPITIDPTVSSTYSAAIGSLAGTGGFSAACQVTMNVNVPASTINFTNTSYQVRALSPNCDEGWLEEQRSRVGAGAGPTWTATQVGVGAGIGTQNYALNNQTIITGVWAGGNVTYTWQGYRTYSGLCGNGCTQNLQRLLNNTWVVTVDYSLTTACTGSPSAGTASIISGSNCTGNNVTLSSTGYTSGTGIVTNWQSSPDGTTGWGDIGGATNPATYAANTPVNRWYRLRVTCNNSAQTSYSNVVSFAVPFVADAGPDINGCAPQLAGSYTGGIAATLYSENFESYANGTLPSGTWGEALFAPTASWSYWAFAGSCALAGSRSLTLYNDNWGTLCDYDEENSIDFAAYTPLINATGYTNLRLNFLWRCAGEAGLDYGQVVYSTDLVNWTALPGFYQGQGTTQTASNVDLSAMNGQQFYLGFRWMNDNSVWGLPPFTIDNITVTGNQALSYAWTGPGTFAPGASVNNPTVNASGTYTLTVAGGGCTSNDNAIATVTAPNAAAYATGDFLWQGTTSTDWLDVNNWLTDNGSAMVTPVALPSPSNDVFIDAAGSCVPNQPTINITGNTIAARDLTIRTGATLTMTGGDLNIYRNITNAGTFLPGTGAVNFYGAANGTITGFTGFHTMRVDKSSATSSITLTGNLRVENTLLMASMGNIITGPNALELGVSAASPGTLTWLGTTVVGNFKRWISASTGVAYTFPVGSNITGSIYNRYARFSYATAPSGGSLTVRFMNVNTPFLTGLPLIDGAQDITNLADEGYWEVVPGDGLSGGTYDLTLRGNNFTTIANLQSLRVLKSPGAHTQWVADGSHAGPNSGTLTDPVVSRTGMSGFSWFTIGSDNLNPLPVEMTAFDASCENGIVKLNWSTASELNNQYFSVQRSDNGTQWLEIGRVPGAGNSNQLLQYVYEDLNKSAGVSYYRLTQTDYDGQSETFDPRSISCSVEGENTAIVYPNPATSEVNIVVTLEKDAGPTMIRLVDKLGRIAHTLQAELKAGENKFTLSSLGLLGPGAYSIVFSNGILALPTQKLVIR